ncbi:MAG TPA: aminotransferase class V-fold PLP-dependent enzyme [Vicinamibacterales bacterium]|nr:aminotransferase class V-fold PLP-dependent enzyme [Vicinamibacterales bacterium]
MTYHPVSSVPPVVAATVEGSYGHHRTPWFERILDHIGASLAPSFPGGFIPIVLTSTIDGAREAIVANCLAPGDPVWVTPADSALASSVSALGAVPRSADVGLADTAEGVPLVLVEHVDRFGRLVPLASLVESIRSEAADAVIVVDASVSFGADAASFEDLDIDGVLVVPEGALMGIPGLSLIEAGPRLLDLVRQRQPRLPVKPYYFDLLKYEKAWAKRTTPYSPDISACVALSKALELLDASGGLGRHVTAHAHRAAAVRERLRKAGARSPDGPLTSAFTVCELSDDAVAREAANAANSDQVRVIALGGARLRLDHTGYVPDDALDACCDRIAAVPETPEGGARTDGSSIPSITFADTTRPNIPPDRGLPILRIPPSEFVEQAVLHARRSGGGASFEARIRDAAEATFRSAHRFDPELLSTRTVGFIGAGNVVRETVERCRAIGIRRLLVYSPSLAEQKRTGRSAGDAADHRSLDYWLQRDVEVCASARDVFLQAHSIVLLPWFYDRAALEVLRKPPDYLNERLIDAAVLLEIARHGRADLIVNAAARGRLVDRGALLEAVSAGWLRYVSDELPSPDDPLLACRNVRFTGHVGGSCREPQAAVGRNTHHILRSLIAHLVDGTDLDAPEASYKPNVLNARLGPSAWRSGVWPPGTRAEVRVLITDRFDLQALDFDGLRAHGWTIEVRDVSAEEPTPERLIRHLRECRPHILMVRSRTRVDADVAAAACEIPELAAVIRPGVGIDNLYGGARQLTEAGIRIINEPFGNSAAVAEMTMHFLVSAAETVLLAPGPTRVVPEVFAVMSEYRHPGSPQVRETVHDVANRMAAWMGASEPALILSGSGTAMMEAGIANLTAIGDHGLVISHGRFGDRFAEIARALGRTVEVLRVPEPEWGRAISPSEVEQGFRRVATAGAQCTFLCLQQNETSSGVAYGAEHLKELVSAARAHAPDIAIIVDAISGAFAHPIEFDALDIDLLVIGSQKGLGVSSGLAFGQLSPRAWSGMLNAAGYPGKLSDWLAETDVSEWTRAFAARQRVAYLSLPALAHDQHRGSFSSPPSTFHLLSARRALDRHERDGGRVEVLARHARLGDAVRRRLSDCGLQSFTDRAYASRSVTPALLPPGVKAPALRKALERTYGFSIAGAQADCWKESMVRIGHLGFVYETDVARCLRALRIVLADADVSATRPGTTARPRSEDAATSSGPARG